MANKRAHDAAKKKAAKEKKILIVLALVLVLAGGYAYKTMMKLHGASPAPNVTPAVSTTSAPTSPTPAVGAASVPGSTTAAPSSQGLVAAVKPVPDQGQLVSFTLFAGKDPFYSDGPSTDAAGTTSAPTQPAPKPKSTHSTSGSGSSQFATPVTSAVISVNGAKSLVTVGGTLPGGIFQLVSLTKTAAKIGIVGGSFASGNSTLTLHVGRAVTLVNTTDGKRYTLELFPQGTSAPPAQTTPTTPTAPTTPTIPTAPMSTPPS